MKTRLLGAVCACVLTSTVNTVSASTVIYDNGVTSTSSHMVSQPSAEQIVADDFLLNAATSISVVEWRGTYSGETPPPDDFTIMLHADIGGSPASTALHTFNLGNSILRSQPDTNFAFSYSAEVPITLDAGIYWLSIYNNLPDNFPRNRWSWIYQLDGNLHYRSQIGGAYSNSIPYKTDFRLYGVVPVPPALYLFCSGLLGLAGVAKRRHKVTVRASNR